MERAGPRRHEPVGGTAIAVREVKLDNGHGYVDYLLFLDGKEVGACEAKLAGFPVPSVEAQACDEPTRPKAPVAAEHLLVFFNASCRSAGLVLPVNAVRLHRGRLDRVFLSRSHRTDSLASAGQLSES